MQICSWKILSLFLSSSSSHLSLTSVVSLPDLLEGAGGSYKLPQPLISDALHTFIFTSDQGWVVEALRGGLGRV